LHNGNLTNPSLSSRQIYLWDAVNGVRRIAALVDSAGLPLEMMPYSFAINNNGTRITFTASNDFVGQNPDWTSELYLWDSVTGLTQITNDAGNGICGTGGRILFFSADNYTNQNPDRHIEIFLYEVNGGYYQLTQTTYLDWVSLGTLLSVNGV
jgi:hypothetical protein